MKQMDRTNETHETADVFLSELCFPNVSVLWDFRFYPSLSNTGDAFYILLLFLLLHVSFTVMRF